MLRPCGSCASSSLIGRLCSCALTPSLVVQAVLAGASSSREGTLCCQAIFALLDTLQKWHGDAKAAAQREQGQSGQAPNGALGLVFACAMQWSRRGGCLLAFIDATTDAAMAHLLPSLLSCCRHLRGGVWAVSAAGAPVGLHL